VSSENSVDCNNQFTGVKSWVTYVNTKMALGLDSN
jgi:hypothetical protein